MFARESWATSYHGGYIVHFSQRWSTFLVDESMKIIEYCPIAVTLFNPIKLPSLAIKCTTIAILDVWRMANWKIPSTIFSGGCRRCTIFWGLSHEIGNPKISSLLFFQLLLFLTPIAKQIKVARSNGISYPKKLTTTDCLQTNKINMWSRIENY